MLLEDGDGLREVESEGLYHGGWAFRKDAFYRVRGYGPHNNGEDQELAGRLHEAGVTEAARRSRACAYLADDDHGPLALQEILLAGCPTVGVRTGASFVRHGETGIVVDRLAPGAHSAESDDDVRALAVFMEAIEEAQSMDRHSVRDRAVEEFNTDLILDTVIESLENARLAELTSQKWSN